MVNRSLNTETATWTLTFSATLPAGANDWQADLAREAGVIIIDRNDLPDVVGDRLSGYQIERLSVGGTSYSSSEEVRQTARAYLALAEYLDAHPPVNEADLRELTGLVELASFEDGSSPDETHPSIVARYLLATGRIEVKPA